ncbi:polysaccharide deacetylase family protein [Aestuariibacter sp. AA17]|uniref:Polysaccharide deacetylase family protein n=1 Tax=Fluctibacter corallii TaxID=2984329 RepID=A0ABT3ABH4_9ALTE|nr:polysaccharide deacetylase family protein [Aestuariibacter sp. AA17]MCV2886032.1 polysaccharide deacetylase family protein [Aestuariibacter sp. AA17]
MLNRFLHSSASLVGSAISSQKLSILIYHQVLESPDPIRDGEPDAETFRWQMALLRRYFTPLSLQAAVKHLQAGTLPANAVCVTFDDGYLDNLVVAQPILDEYDIPATVFVATHFCEHQENMWNDRIIDLIADKQRDRIDLRALGLPSVALGGVEERKTVIQRVINLLKYKHIEERYALVQAIYDDNHAQEYPCKMMTFEQIKALSDKGVEIGAHTVMHPILKSHSEDEQEQQISDSKNKLEQLLGQPVVSFAYPNGKRGVDYDDVAVKVVNRLGFDIAVSTDWGVSTSDTDKLQLNRFTPWDLSPLKFHLRLLRNIAGV